MHLSSNSRERALETDLWKPRFSVARRRRTQSAPPSLPGQITEADRIAAELREMTERLLAHQEPLARAMDELRRRTRPD